MFRPLSLISRIIPTLTRMTLISIMIFSPIVAVSYAGDQNLRIDAPSPGKTGAGFVLLMTLQRR